jgi:protein-L-isoaspartate(D-aspartate) O-methyltransferase
VRDVTLATSLLGVLLPCVALAAAAAARGAESPPAATPGATPGETPAARELRARLVEDVASRDPQLGVRTLDALRAVPRHLFVPGASLGEAYANHALPIGHGQTISQPTVVAIMTDALRLDGTERVLEIGTGSGYQAAVLSRLVREVDSIELVPELAAQAAARLRALGYAKVQVRAGDGYAGWPERAPYDRIVLTAAPPELPPALVEQLREGGILVAPVGTDDQFLYRWIRRDGRMERESLGAVRFVPMVSSTPRR